MCCWQKAQRQEPKSRGERQSPDTGALEREVGLLRSHNSQELINVNKLCSQI